MKSATKQPATVAGSTAGEREQLIEVMARAIGGPFPVPLGSYTSGSRIGIAMHSAEAALTALEAAGVCLVPKEATEEMVLAGANLVMTFDDQAKDCYAAMLSASPYRP